MRDEGEMNIIVPKYIDKIDRRVNDENTKERKE